MGLFSFVGKAIKAVGKVAGIIPGVGNTIKGITGVVGNLLDSKSPMSTTAAKLALLNRSSVPVLRAKSGGGPVWQVLKGNQTAMSGLSGSTPTIQAASPVLPGGAVATSSGAMNAGSGVRYITRRAPKKRKKAATKRRATKKKATRRKGSRKLKFGSAAYRKKYLGHR